MKDTLSYHNTIQLLRNFFLKKGFIETPTQPRLSILAACEDPFTVRTFEQDNVIQPLPQTGQMQLEYELLKNPNYKGVFCISTSYRNEPNPIEGRHEKIFPMFEFESHGGFNELIKLEKELLSYLGFNNIVEKDYEDLCKEYNTSILDSNHELKMFNEISPSVMLERFPERTHPFQNMKNNNGIFNKIDVILCGQETIGSAERSCNIDEMLYSFNHVSDGAYRDKLYELFGKDRVDRELDDFFKHDFIPRFGGGIGVNRMARALNMNNDLPF